MHTINLPYKQGYVTPVPAAVVVNTYEFREAEDPSTQYSRTVMTPLKNRMRSQAIEGYFLNENLRPN